MYFILNSKEKYNVFSINEKVIIVNIFYLDSSMLCAKKSNKINVLLQSTELTKEAGNSEMLVDKNMLETNAEGSTLIRRKSDISAFITKSQWQGPAVWNQSALAMTRDKSPSHAFPKSRRFPSSSDQYPGPYQELSPSLRGKLNKGVKFTADHRHELFTLEPTPSPQAYNCRRYLDQFIRKKKSASAHKKRPEGLFHEVGRMGHIKGGTFGRSANHWALYCPQSNVAVHNDRKIKEAADLKNFANKFSIKTKRKRLATHETLYS